MSSWHAKQFPIKIEIVIMILTFQFLNPIKAMIDYFLCIILRLLLSFVGNMNEGLKVDLKKSPIYFLYLCKMMCSDTMKLNEWVNVCCVGKRLLKLLKIEDDSTMKQLYPSLTFHFLSNEDVFTPNKKLLDMKGYKIVHFFPFFFKALHGK